MLKKYVRITVFGGFAFLAGQGSAHAQYPTYDASANALLGTISGSVATDVANFVFELQQWADANLDSAFKLALDKASTMMKMELDTVNAQAGIIADRDNKMADEAGKVAAQHEIPQGTNACATTVIQQDAAKAGVTVNAALNSMMGMTRSVGVGVNADPGSAAFVAAEVNDLCRLGFLDTSGNGRYGKLPISMNCTDAWGADYAGKYIDADMNVSSVLDRLSLPLPEKDKVFRASDGRISFYPPPNTNINNSGISAGSNPALALTMAASPIEDYPHIGSELDFVAAFKFCEHLRVPAAAPPRSGGSSGMNPRPPSIEDIVNIKMDRDGTSVRTAAESECWRALSYRMTCPKNSETALEDVGGGASCHTSQKALCDRLIGERKKGGLGLTFKDASGKPTHPVFSSALDACADPNYGGISLAMYDAIIAHKCEDDNYVHNIPAASDGKGATFEHIVSFECPALKDRYELKMQNERALFLNSIQNLMAVRSLPSPGGSSRISQ